MSTVAVHLERLLDPFTDCLTPDVAVKIANMQADKDVQARIDYLADQANEGLLTADEDEEYTTYLHAIDVIAVIQAKARSQIRRPA